jgi:hypothetical protein
VCVTIGSTGDATGQKFNFTRFAFFPTVDSFTRLDLKHSWSSQYYSEDTLFSKLYGSSSVPSTTELWMHFESEGLYSYQKVFRAGAQTFPTAVAVVSVNAGKVDGVTWDFGCFDCAADSCGLNSYKYSGEAFAGAGDECYSQDAACASALAAGGADKDGCSLQVYVTWSGTDKHGNFLLSQQKRLSNFQQGSTGL